MMREYTLEMLDIIALGFVVKIDVEEEMNALDSAI